MLYLWYTNHNLLSRITNIISGWTLFLDFLVSLLRSLKTISIIGRWEKTNSLWWCTFTLLACSIYESLFPHFCSSNWPLSYLWESSTSELISQVQISVIHSCNNSYSGIYQHKHDVTELKIRTIRFFRQLSKKSEKMGYIIYMQDENHVMTPPSLSAESIRRTGTVVYAYNFCIYSGRGISVSKLLLTLQLLWD